MNTLKTIVVLPAYNAAETLKKTIDDIPLDYVQEVLLVDDASNDGTYELSQEIAATHKVIFSVIRHEENKGYGGTQKSCYAAALAREADIIVMLHPDYQYDPRFIKEFVHSIYEDGTDVMLGSRIRSRAETLAGGMPVYKYLGNRFLSVIQNFVSGQRLSEWHTGMRAYKREVLESVGYESFSNDFVFDTQILFATLQNGYSIGEVPVPVRYFKEASSIGFVRSMRYGVLTLFETGKFFAHKYL